MITRCWGRGGGGAAKGHQGLSGGDGNVPDRDYTTADICQDSLACTPRKAWFHRGGDGGGGGGVRAPWA